MEKIGKDCWDWDPWPFGTIPFCHPAPHPGKAKARSPVHVDLSFLLTTRTNSAWQRQERRCHLYIWLQYAWIFPAQLGRTMSFATKEDVEKGREKTPKNQPNAVTVCFLAKIHQSHWQEGSNCCWWCRATIGCETWDGESIWRNQAPHRPWRAHNLLPDMWRTRIVSSYVKLGISRHAGHQAAVWLSWAQKPNSWQWCLAWQKTEIPWDFYLISNPSKKEGHVSIHRLPNCGLFQWKKSSTKRGPFASRFSFLHLVSPRQRECSVILGFPIANFGLPFRHFGYTHNVINEI